MEEPKNFSQIFALAASLRDNNVIHTLERDPEAQTNIAIALARMGQKRFINMVTNSYESNMGLTLYAGDGNITKILRGDQGYYNEKHLTLYDMHPVTSQKIETQKDNIFLIQTYPYVKSPLGTSITNDHVKKLCDIQENLGFHVPVGDDDPRNFRRLPDAKVTLTGIDSDMYGLTHPGKLSEELLESWKEYLAMIYPVYNDHTLLRQNENTNFEFISAHNPDARNIYFDHTAENPIVEIAGTPEIKNQQGRMGIFKKLINIFASNNSEYNEAPKNHTEEPSANDESHSYQEPPSLTG